VVPVKTGKDCYDDAGCLASLVTHPPLTPIHLTHSSASFRISDWLLKGDILPWKKQTPSMLFVSEESPLKIWSLTLSVYESPSL
jgi:hypothetical protein